MVDAAVLNNTTDATPHSPAAALSLTWLHQVSGAIFSRIAIAFGAFEYKHVPWREVFPMYGLNMLAVVMQNWSLQVNSIDFYQLMKALMLPWSAVTDLVLRGQILNHGASLVVAVMTVGAVLVAVSDLSTLTCTVTGLCVALLSVAITPLPIAFFGPLMRKHSVSALQLFTQGSVAAAAVLTPFVLLEVAWRDNQPASAGLGAGGGAMPSRTAEHLGGGGLVGADAADRGSNGGDAGASIIPMALLSCMCAYGINFTVNAMARDWQGVTYFVINNFKSTLIIAMGVFVFGNGHLPLQKLAGMMLAVGGQFSYPFAKQGINPFVPGACARLMSSGSGSTSGRDIVQVLPRVPRGATIV